MSTSYGIDVLAFGPHPDDVDIFCGGILIVLADLGYRTGIVDLTRGELASQGTVEERAKEAERAAEVMGLSVRENLGLPDGFIDPAPGSPHVPVVVAAIRRLRPELMLIPWFEERHPDHVAAAELLTRAAFMAGLNKFEAPGGAGPATPRQTLHYEMRYRMTPSFIVDTSSAWDRKARAIGCHTSQLTRRNDGLPPLIGSALALEAIEARDRYRGSEIGVRHGEALYAAQTLELTDPVAHFRSGRWTRAHAFEPRR